MNCQLCQNQTEKVYKVVKKIEIFECCICQLGFIDQNVLTKAQLPQDDTNKLYDFETYRKNERRFRERFDRLTEKITNYKKSGNVLDIGAGFGLFSSELQTKGNFKFDLIEPTQIPHYADKFKHELIKTTFEKFRTKKKYDVILMMDVLEHFRDPVANLRKAKSLLKSDGILVIQTPNYKSLMARICKDWAWWMVEDHKFFFSPTSLRKILSQPGFKSEYFITYEDWTDFKKNLDGNFVGITNNILRKLVKGVFFAFFFSVYFLTRSVLWKLNHGGLLFVIAKKSFTP